MSTDSRDCGEHLQPSRRQASAGQCAPGRDGAVRNKAALPIPGADTEVVVRRPAEMMCPCPLGSGSSAVLSRPMAGLAPHHLERPNHAD
jgi:hypothetical protein